MKYLMINADDFGMCHAMNEATIGLLEDNLITSATLMAPCPWFVEAAQYASSHPEKCIGVHLTLTSEWQPYRWGPVARTSLPSLVDKDGYFPMTGLEVETNANEVEVEIELRAQLEQFKHYGITASHIDNHMGTLYGWAGVQSFLPLAFKLCAELGLPFRFPRGVVDNDDITDNLPASVLDKLPEAVALADTLGVPLADYMMAPPFVTLPGETYEHFRESICQRLEALGEGIFELILHPSFDSPEIRAMNPHWERRVWEEKLCRDELFRETIKRSGFQMITWRDVPELAKRRK
jgi:chitin disaccharide deacetylase